MSDLSIVLTIVFVAGIVTGIVGGIVCLTWSKPKPEEIRSWIDCLKRDLRRVERLKRTPDPIVRSRRRQRLMEGGISRLTRN